MTNEIVPAAARAVATLEGAQALRAALSSGAMAAMTTNEGQARALITPALRATLPVAQQEALSALEPAAPEAFNRTLTPTLALVAPAGMSVEDQTAWLAAAAETLRGIPADLLDAACQAVRQRVDHPSKIVAGIFAEVGKAWDGRKATAGNIARLLDLSGEPATAADEAPSSADVAALIADLAQRGRARGEAVPAVRRPKPSAPARLPTANDYEAMGHSPAEARAAANQVRAHHAAVGLDAAAPSRRRHARRDGWRALAATLASRFLARRLGQPVDGYTRSARILLEAHGTPPLPALIAATRRALPGLAARQAA